MKRYQEEQENMKKRSQDTIARHVRIVNPNATEEDIQNALESGGGEQYFADKIMMGSKEMATTRTIYVDVQEKHRDILKIETSMEELHQLFVDMAVLVDSQQELFDNISSNVANSVNFVEKARENLHVARKHQGSARKVTCIIIVVVIVIAVIIIIIAAVVVPLLVKYKSVL